MRSHGSVCISRASCLLSVFNILRRFNLHSSHVQISRCIDPWFSCTICAFVSFVVILEPVEICRPRFSSQSSCVHRRYMHDLLRVRSCCCSTSRKRSRPQSIVVAVRCHHDRLRRSSVDLVWTVRFMCVTLSFVLVPSVRVPRTSDYPNPTINSNPH